MNIKKEELNMTHVVSTLQKRWQQPFFILLAGAVLIALVALSQTAFAAQGQEKAEVGPWSPVKEQGTRDKGHKTNDQTAFTYQGQLKDASGPVNGAFDFRFILHSAQTGGEQLGSIDMEDLALTNGLFNVRLDFGRAVLEAKEGWLEIGVRPGGSSEPYTVLFPRQKLTPTPYAIFAQHEPWSLIGMPVGFARDAVRDADVISMEERRDVWEDERMGEKAALTRPHAHAPTPAPTKPPAPEASPQQGSLTGSGTPATIPLWIGDTVLGDSSISQADGAVNISNTGLRVVPGDFGTGIAVYAIGGSGRGVLGESISEIGVDGQSQSGPGVRGQSTSAPGVFGQSDSHVGVGGTSASGNGVQGESDSGNGVAGRSASGRGVLGQSTSSVGVEGRSTSNTGVRGESSGGAGVRGESSSGPGVLGISQSGSGVVGQSSSAIGVLGDSDSDIGVQGQSESSTGVRGISTSGIGVHGESTSDVGVRGQTTSGIGVEGTSTSDFGVKGESQSAAGVRGISTSGTGVFGSSTSGIGAGGLSESGNGVQGVSNTRHGVVGISTRGFGVVGQSTSNDAVVGNSTSGRGVVGQSETTHGVVGFSTSGAGAGGISERGVGIVGMSAIPYTSGGRAGEFMGNVVVEGAVAKRAGLFHIDHPLDPANKYLNHSFVESPDMKNIYDGVVTLDANGEAVVELPVWFQALNKDFRYQLTCIGGFAPVYIAEKIKGNRFKIAGGSPSLEISWQVTGIRQDAWANAHRIVVEEDKPDNERGYYLEPELFGEPEEKSLHWLRYPDLMKAVKQMKDAQSLKPNGSQATATPIAEPMK